MAIKRKKNRAKGLKKFSRKKTSAKKSKAGSIDKKKTRRGRKRIFQKITTQSITQKGSQKVKREKAGYKKDDLKHFKEVILNKIAKLKEELGYLEESSFKKTTRDSTGDLSAYAYHMADQATDNQEREKAFLFAAREGNFLTHLEKALERIEDGSYGICANCGVLIAKERLEAVPHVRLCIDCKRKEEEAKAV